MTRLQTFFILTIFLFAIIEAKKKNFKALQEKTMSTVKHRYKNIDSGLNQNAHKKPKNFKAPTLGIVTQPAKGKYRKYGYYSLIPASYAEWVEQLGANVVPIPYSLEKDQILTLLKKVNGVIFPGGGTKVFGKSQYEFYRSRVYFIMDEAVKLNKSGVNFPIWGTCMGFEQILSFFSGFTIRPSVVGNYHVDRRVHWNDSALKKSRIAKHLSKKSIENLENSQLSYFNHKFGITSQDFEKNMHLQKNLYNLADTYSVEGINFLSFIEGRDYPIFGSQFHPEKVQFEHTKVNFGMNISKSAIKAAKKFGQVLLNEAALNKNAFKCKKTLSNLLIENFQMKYTGTTFESIYFFDEYDEKFDALFVEDENC